MEKSKDVLRGGWHPTGKDGGKESWRGDFKGINQVAGWVGKGKTPTSESSTGKEHTSRSLASLKDPDTFGPPPKNVNFHAGPAVPNGSSSDWRGTGTLLSEDQSKSQKPRQQGISEAGESKKAPPPLPYRSNAPKSPTNALPKPPTRRANSGTDPSTQSLNQRPRPNPPPRLPPRQDSHPRSSPPISPPSYVAAAAPSPTKLDQDGHLESDAPRRLHTAGVSVPEFGIGNRSSKTIARQKQPSLNTSTSPSKQTTFTSNSLSPHISHLQTTSLPVQSKANPSQPSTGGTTWAEKRAALKTANDFRNDPQNITLSDAKATAFTANDFRERHGEQVASGWKTGSALNKKYGVADKVNARSGIGDAVGSQGNETTLPNPRGESGQIASRFGQAASGFRKAPPPLPPGVGSPPPVPLSSKPR